MASTRIFLKVPPAYRGFFHVNANFVDLALEIATMAKTAKAKIIDFSKCRSLCTNQFSPTWIPPVD